MKLILNKVEEDENVTINYIKLNDEINGIISYINNSNIVGYIGSEAYNIDLKNIYYFEGIDNKNFIYTKDNCYECRYKLYELEDLKLNTFIRISKSIILNIKKISKVKGDLSGRLEATLKNNEKIIISRKYKSILKERLGL